ncbi:MAG: MarR family winged helix-turn-helix transcriptional regulator [bacterium]|nr:MarR family winged helix-turn-helix transcriptional regulator [bacterium]
MKENPGRLISILYRKSQIHWGQVLKEYDLSSAEYPVLIQLFKQDGRTQEDLTAEIVIDKSAIARVVQSLVEKGIVEKKKDPIDKRCNRIYLTEQGRQCKEPIEQGVKEWNSILTKDMQMEEMQEIMRLLRQMADNVQDQSERQE